MGAVLVARHNLRLGRGDRKGAAKIAVAAFLSGMCWWGLATTHMASLAEIGLLFNGTSTTAFISGLLWIAYLAAEPYARRNWPDSLISWNRVLGGRLRDPLVASHVLAGFLAFYAAVAVISIAVAVVSAPPFEPYGLGSLTSISRFVAAYLGTVQGSLIGGTAALLLLVLMRMCFAVCGSRTWSSPFYLQWAASSWI